MQFKTISIGLLGLFSFGLLVHLMMNANANEEVELEESVVLKAKGEFKRQENRSPQRAAPPPPVSRNKFRSELPKSEKKNRPVEKSKIAASLTSPRLAQPMTAAAAPEEGLRERMSLANRLYDQTDYEGAREAALEILADNDENVRMLRIVVSTSCIMGDGDVAIKHHQSLPKRDKQQMARRCKRYGIEFDNE